MMKLGIVTLALMVSVLSQAGTQDQIWVARMTDDVQCERIIKRSSLGQALDDLETRNSVAVEQAMISKLDGVAVCTSCDCPAGNYFVAKIKITNNTANNLEGGWTVVDPRKIRKLAPALSQVPSHTIQPVIPTR